MKKIPTIFERDWSGDKSRVTDECNPAALWVFKGEGVATRKYDGMACMFNGTQWYKRRELRDEDIARKGIPDGFIESDRDDTTAKTTGWVPVGDGPEDKYIRAASTPAGSEPGTYEFLGPKSQGNAERDFNSHVLIPHARATKYPECPRTFDGVRAFLDEHDIEGIVWHHPDGRMAKIKKRDFGLRRKA